MLTRQYVKYGRWFQSIKESSKNKYLYTKYGCEFIINSMFKGGNFALPYGVLKNAFSSLLVFVCLYNEIIGLGGLGITCSPRDLRFVGSNPAEVDGFFRTEKS